MKSFARPASARNSDCAGTFLNRETGIAEHAICVAGRASEEAAPGTVMRRCVQVTSPDCRETAFPDGGGRVPDDAILLGALMPFTGVQRDNTPPRLASAILAMEQIAKTRQRHPRDGADQCSRRGWDPWL